MIIFVCNFVINQTKLIKAVPYSCWYNAVWNKHTQRLPLGSKEPPEHFTIMLKLSSLR